MIEGIYCIVCRMETTREVCIKKDEHGLPSPCPYMPKAAVGDGEWFNVDEPDPIEVPVN